MCPQWMQFPVSAVRRHMSGLGLKDIDWKKLLSNHHSEVEKSRNAIAREVITYYEQNMVDRSYTVTAC